MSIQGITLPAPWAWAVSVGNAAVINLGWRPPDGTVGTYLAVLASRAQGADAREEEDELRGYIAARCGVGVPPEEELAPLRGHVLAVARVQAISTHANDSRVLRNNPPWARGPIALWLHDVTSVPPVRTVGGPASRLWPLEERVLADVREGWLGRRAADAARAAAHRDLNDERPARNPCPCGSGPRFLAFCRTCGTWWCDRSGHPRHPLPTCAAQLPLAAGA